MDTLTVQVWKLDFSAFKSPAAKLVALAIARRSRESGSCWAKHATIGDDCGVSKQTVARCIQEMVEAGWLQKVERRRGDGSRSSDKLWLTLPAVMLFATTVDPKELKRERADGEDDGDHGGLADHHDDEAASPRMASGPTSVMMQKDSSKDSKERTLVPDEPEGDFVDYPGATSLIWQRASKTGRQRSSKMDIEKALRAAVSRGHALERILKGLGAYFASPDATKDDGAYQRGAHVILANDRWAGFLDDEQARADVGEVVTPAALAAQQQVGTAEAPAEARQRLWMELWKQGMPWDPERGPQPGRLGCRITDAIQREFGAEPYQPPQDGDSAAFD